MKTFIRIGIRQQNDDFKNFRDGAMKEIHVEEDSFVFPQS